MPSLKRIVASPAFQESRRRGRRVVSALRLGDQRDTVVEPADIYERIDDAGDHRDVARPAFPDAVHQARRGAHRAKVLISRHRDGEINARAAEQLGIGTIRGSGAHNGEFHRKGGAAAFTEMLDALSEGYNVAMTADVPKVARVAGMGVVKLAQHSGRPIYPVAIASSRRIVLDNWDRTAVNLPFSRMATGRRASRSTCRRDADDAALEAARQRVENELNASTARAYEIADRTEAPRRERPAAGSLARLPAAVGGGAPLAPLLLARRLKRGKEHPAARCASGAARARVARPRARWSGCTAPASAN